MSPAALRHGLRGLTFLLWGVLQSDNALFHLHTSFLSIQTPYHSHLFPPVNQQWVPTHLTFLLTFLPKDLENLVSVIIISFSLSLMKSLDLRLIFPPQRPESWGALQSCSSNWKSCCFNWMWERLCHLQFRKPFHFQLFLVIVDLLSAFRVTHQIWSDIVRLIYRYPANAALQIPISTVTFHLHFMCFGTGYNFYQKLIQEIKGIGQGSVQGESQHYTWLIE